MKKLNHMALLLGAGLFLSMGTTTLSASDMKCGAGKCGSSMKKPASKCGGDKATKCGASKNTAKCGGDKKATKCGGDKKVPKKSAKCGTGKCS